MSLTTAQLSTLKTAILADQTLTTLVQQQQYGQIAAYYNEAAAPAYIVWRTSVRQDEIMQNGFDWVRVDNLSVGKARIWDWLFRNSSASINPSKANVRAGIAECWKGTAADLAVQAAVLSHCKRGATRGEKVFAVGSGTDASPATMGYEGDITGQHVATALAMS